MPRLLACLPLLLCAAFAGAAEPLRVAWGAHNAPPYAIVEREQLTGGVIRDIGDAAANLIGTTASYASVPRARYEAQLQSGVIDMACITNPQWLKQPESLVWSPPLFEETDVLAQRADSRSWDSLQDLDGQRIGTIRAYHYPNLEALFSAQRVIRDDGGSLDGNMRRLVLGRLDAVLDAQIPLQYWMRTNNMTEQLSLASVEISRHPVHCAISPLARPGHATVLNALTELVRDGSVQRILKRYLDTQ